MQNSNQKHQVVKLFRDKPAELLSNNHSMEEAKKICQSYMNQLLIQGIELDSIEYILAYQFECNNCKTNHKHN
jgi:hypothetical protein